MSDVQQQEILARIKILIEAVNKQPAVDASTAALITVAACQTFPVKH